MKKIILSLCVAILGLSSCSADSDFLLTQDDPACTESESHIHVPQFSNEEKWEQISTIYDFRGWMVVKTWIDEQNRMWMTYEDVDGMDWGDFQDGCPDMQMPIEVDADSWNRFHQHFTPLSAMYCSECSLWHIYYDEFSYED